MDANRRIYKVGTTGARAVVLVSLIASFSLAGGVWARGMPAQHIKQQLRAGGYRIVLEIGPPEMMSTNARSGERMLNGKSATCGMKGMKSMAITNSGPGALPACNHHLALHVYKGKQVVKNARVIIAVINAQRHIMLSVPVMTMYQVAKGLSDYHYGNNVLLPAGDYSVQATVNTATAIFGIHLT